MGHKQVHKFKIGQKKSWGSKKRLGDARIVSVDRKKGTVTITVTKGAKNVAKSS